jgi:hypothetical protein
MIRYLATILALFVSAIVTSAQNSPPIEHQHVMAATNVIDGAVNPELIPDSVAYRLCLVALSTGKNPTEDEQKQQHAQITRTALASADQQMFISILSDFRSKYDALVTEYNDSARAALAHNELTDVHTLLRKLDDLVQSTRDAMSARLSSHGAARLHSFVLSEKKNMKVQGD